MSLTREHAMFAELAQAMKKTVARQANESDSDSEIQQITNRGNKLKKRAKFVRQGKLGPPTGSAVYREEVEHAGYNRAIISRNPPLLDEDGYIIDSDDDEQRIQDAVATAAEADPYSSIRLAQLLAPLASVMELPNHPTMSRPFLSTALNALTNQACDLMHKENNALWKVRPLLTRLSGDHTWVTPEMFLGPDDDAFFKNTSSWRTLKRKGSQGLGGAGRRTSLHVNGDSSITRPLANGVRRQVIQEASSQWKPKCDVGDVAMTDDYSNNVKEEVEKSRELAGTANEGGQPSRRTAKDVPETATKKTLLYNDKDGVVVEIGGRQANNGHAGTHKVKETESRQDLIMEDATMVEDGTAGPYHHGRRDGMREGSAAPASGAECFIHPIYLAPKQAQPDRDLILPEQEAEDVRRLLQMYVQKQEEVCRGTEKLYQGLLRADSLRRTVLEWSKAEAHVGELSDGEDWYDKEAWGLTEDLKKGQDEEEEDTTQTQKKTRNRK